MATPHEILINVDKERKFSSKKHLALPGVLFVKKDDTVQFYAKNSIIHIFFPKANELFGLNKEEYVKKIDRGGKTEILTVKIKPLNNVLVYPYAVYCEDGGDFAEGNSSPKIIVE